MDFPVTSTDNGESITHSSTAENLASRKYIPIGIILAVITFLIHTRTGLTVNTDSMWSVYVAHSIIHERNLNLNEFRQRIKAYKKYGLRIRGKNYYPYFPIGPSLVAVPIIAFLQAYPTFLHLALSASDIQRLENSLKARATTTIPDPSATAPVLIAYRSVERLVGSMTVALSSMLIFLIAARHLPLGYAILVFGIFAFCTPAWSTASRGLWQHGPSMLMLTLVLYLFITAATKPQFVLLAAVPLGLSYLMRPTNVIPLALFSAYVFFTHRRFMLPFIGILFLSLLPLFLHSWSAYNTLLPPYYRAQRANFSLEIVQALFANLISPNRGIFIFSPIFLVSLIGIWLHLRAPRKNLLDTTIFLCLTTHLIIISTVSHWWAGHSYGPRYMCDMTPFLTYFLIPPFAALAAANTPRNIILKPVVLVLVATSFYAHWRGATKQSTVNWNLSPHNIDEHPSRVWDWHDLQMTS